MSWKWLKAALATALVVAVMAGVGLLNTYRWYSALPPYMAAVRFPASLYFGAVVLAVQFVAATFALVGAAFGSTSSGRRRVFSGLAVLLAVHLITWLQRSFAGSSGLELPSHLVRLLVAAWLAFLLYRLAPNNSSKPTPLRAAA